MTEPLVRPPFVRPDVRAFLDYVAAAGRPPVNELDAPAAREVMRVTKQLADREAGDIAVRRDLTMPGPDGTTIPLRLFDARPKRTLPGPVMLFFHGGGFVIGDLDTHEPVCAEIARVLDLPVVSVDYRLAPEAKFPAAPDDCEAAARWVATSTAALGVKASALVLAGDSAGGALTLVTAMALRDAPADVPVVAMWPIYPTLGRADTDSFHRFSEGFVLTRDAMRWFSDHYAAAGDDWRGVPGLGRFDGLPPALVIAASLDPLLDEGRECAARLIAGGVPTIYREAVGNIHGFMNLRRAIPSSEGDLQGCLAVLKPMIAEAEANRVMAQAAAGTG